MADARLLCALYNPPLSSQYRGHVAILAPDATLDLNFSAPAGRALARQRRDGVEAQAMRFGMEVETLLDLLQLVPLDTDLHVAAIFTPFEEQHPHLAPLQYYRDLVHDVPPSTLLRTLQCLECAPNACVATAILATTLDPAKRLVFGTLGFGPARTGPDIEYGEDKWAGSPLK